MEGTHWEHTRQAGEHELLLSRQPVQLPSRVHPSCGSRHRERSRDLRLPELFVL
jgi:hypothetical protein